MNRSKIHALLLMANPMAKKYLMLVMADAKNNHNKFYEIRLEENDEVLV